VKKQVIVGILIVLAVVLLAWYAWPKLKPYISPPPGPTSDRLQTPGGIPSNPAAQPTPTPQKP
jgi:hypothetical protein